MPFRVDNFHILSYEKYFSKICFETCVTVHLNITEKFQIFPQAQPKLRESSFVVCKVIRETNPYSYMSSLSFLLTDSVRFHLTSIYMKRTDIYLFHMSELDCFSYRKILPQMNPGYRRDNIGLYIYIYVCVCVCVCVCECGYIFIYIYIIIIIIIIIMKSEEQKYYKYFHYFKFHAFTLRSSIFR